MIKVFLGINRLLTLIKFQKDFFKRGRAPVASSVKVDKFMSYECVH